VRCGECDLVLWGKVGHWEKTCGRGPGMGTKHLGDGDDLLVAG